MSHQPSQFPRRRVFLLLSTFALTASATSLRADPPTPATPEPVTHRFLCCDYQGNKVAIVSAKGDIEWEVTAEHPQDCWMLPNGHIVFCYRSGMKVVARDKSVIVDYKAPAGAECHSCQPLPDGRVLVAECGLSRLVEIGPDGKIAKEIKVASQAKNMGHQFRGTRRTADGHYWTCLMDEKKIVELDTDGTLLREIPVDGYPHAAVKLANNHLLVTLGQAGKVIEIDEKLKVVWEIAREEIPGNPLRLPAGCLRRKNGNTIIANYLGGGFEGKQPQAFEITPDKTIVWEFPGHPRFKTINQIHLLDANEDGKETPLQR